MLLSNYWLTLDLAFGLPLLTIGFAARWLGGKGGAKAPARPQGGIFGWTLLAVAAASVLSWGAIQISRTLGLWSLGFLAVLSYLPVVLLLLLIPAVRQASLIDSARPSRALLAWLTAGALGWVTGVGFNLFGARIPMTWAFFEVFLLQTLFAFADEFCLRGVLLGQILVRVRNQPAALILAAALSVAIRGWESVPRNGLIPGLASLFVLTLLKNWAAWRIGYFGVSALSVAVYRLMGVIGI